MTNPAKGSDSAAADAARHFRQTLGHYPTGVAIITAAWPFAKTVFPML